MWCGGLCHVPTGDGKARAMREMERDLRLGVARAMPTTVGSLLIASVRMEGQNDARGPLTVRNGSHLGKAPRQDLSAARAGRRTILLVARGR